MPGRTFLAIAAFALGALASARPVVAETAAGVSGLSGTVEAIVSVAEQKLIVLKDGMWTHKFPISTSKFGLGDGFGTYKTPLGKHRVCEKIGDGLVSGAVIRKRSATGEVLAVNAPGRDPIVTRILWLEGLESQNANARARGIYIHGTVEESKIGEPVSYGCIRMRSRDVIQLYGLLDVGTAISIQTEKFPKIARWTQKAAQLIAAAAAPKVETKPAEIAEVKTLKQALGDETVSAPTPAKLVASGKSKPVASGKAFDAFKGSILHADLPGGPRLNSSEPLENIRGPVLETAKEPAAAESPEESAAKDTGAARVSFRANAERRAVQ